MPSAHVSPGAFALVAMGATFGAAARATFTSIAFLFELTRDYNIILPLMLAAVVADIVAGALLHESLMTEKLARRRVSVPGEYRPDVMSTTPVREIMTVDVTTLPARRVSKKVMRAIELMIGGKAKTITDAAAQVGLSRETLSRKGTSAFSSTGHIGWLRELSMTYRRGKTHYRLSDQLRREKIHGERPCEQN